jgi:hypothetical protein
MANNETQKVASAFEKKYGAGNLSKIVTSSLIRLLVQKGIISREEIEKYFIEELKMYSQKGETNASQKDAG